MSLVWMLLRRFSLRHARLTPKQSLLLLLILTLGVAVFVSIRLANRAAVASFEHFTETLTGQSDWIIQAPAGTLGEEVLGELRAALGPQPVQIIPVVEATASPPPASGETTRFGRPTYTLLGLDLLAVANLARGQSPAFFGQNHRAGGDNDFWASFRSGPQLWLSPAFARPLPASVELVLDEQIRSLPVAGLIPAVPDAPAAPSTLIILDLPQLQALTGKIGRLDRVEFIAEPGPALDSRREALHARLVELGRSGERWTVTSPGARRETAATMTRAFRLNLTVLSLIALLVGLYLIFQALDGAVVRRRSEIAILRSLGVEEHSIRLAWLAESAVLGLAGGGLGLLLGWAGAQVAVRAVGETVNALYYTATVHAAGLAPVEIAIGLSLGLVAALAAGWWPAREAARTPPAQILQRSAAPAAGTGFLRSLAGGAACLVAGWLLLQLPPLHFAGGGRFPVAGYAAAFAWIFGAGALAGFLLPPLGQVFLVFGPNSAPVRIAAGHLRRPSGRHQLAVAALLCAIAMTAGMAILVGSFESTVRGWISRALQADLYVSSSGAQSASAHNRISGPAARAIAAHPAVADAARLIAYPIDLDGTATQLSGADLGDPRTRPDFPWVEKPRDDAIFDPARNTDLALVSESFSERFRKHRGDTVRLPTPAGPRALRIAGVFADYGNEHGSLLVERSHVQAWFGEDAVTSLALYLKPGIEPDTLRTELRKTYPGLSVLTNRNLRDEVLRVFRQTFSITYALEVIGVAVAVAGLALSLVSVLLDRRDELTTLRALGFSRHEIALAASLEGFAVALGATIGGLVLSLGLGWILIHVVNKQSFGWTLGFALPWAQLAALGLIVTATGAGVSYAVGRWGADLPADREE